MTKSLAEARDYARAIRTVEGGPGVHPFVIPAATAIHVVAEELVASLVRVGA